MIASDVVITDSDWHGIYDRTDYVATPKPVKIHKNVWIGERSIILKGTQIGENSIIGAGSVVHGDIPPNSIYAGNPAKEVKKLFNFFSRITSVDRIWWDIAMNH